MKTVNDIPELFDTQDSNDKRILINIPDESRPFILLDYNHGFDWTIEQYDGEIELTLLDRDTRTVIRRSYPDYQQIVTDGQNIMVLSSRTTDRLERYRREAAVDGVVMQFRRANGLGNYTWSDIRCIDEDHSIAVIEAFESNSNDLHIIVVTSETKIIPQDEPHIYLLEGEYFVNKTTLKAPLH
nr:MAG TPA: hypothetical protein [Caudoviricetes sp.]